MTLTAQEFVYKLPGLSAGNRAGAHRSDSRGAGMRFATHARLFDFPDPRRIDLRASLSDLRRDWLVRTHHQRTSVAIKAIVDVSASMRFGTIRSKLAVVADFLGALGYSAHRAGDAVSLMAFDAVFRDDLYLPASRSRGMGMAMANRIRDCQTGVANDSYLGLVECIEHVAGTAGLVFLVSDFHWSLDKLEPLLDGLTHSLLVPLVFWDRAEIEPPAQSGLLSVRDAETGVLRHLWLGNSTRRQWDLNVARRRAEITRVFAAHNTLPCYVEDNFNAETLSRYFLEQVV